MKRVPPQSLTWRVDVDAPHHHRKDPVMTTMTASALGSPRRHHALIPSPPPRCLKCGTTPTTPDVAELIETDELCPECRAADLRDSAKEIHDAVADLARDALPAMSRGLLPIEVEQLELVVAYSALALLATTSPQGLADMSALLYERAVA